EAGAHAWAARNGSYGPLTMWTLDGDALRGAIELPLAVAAGGGHLELNPRARLPLPVPGAESARERAAVMAAGGLRPDPCSPPRPRHRGDPARSHGAPRARPRAARTRGELSMAMTASFPFVGRAPDALAQRLDEAIARAQARLLGLQRPDGYWHAPLEANV